LWTFELQVVGSQLQPFFNALVDQNFDIDPAIEFAEKGGISQHDAASLHQMLAQNREKFDPLLIKAFINTVGMYPAGTTVLLDTNEIAVVISHNATDIFRPKVQVVADSDRKPVADGAIIDLTARDEANANYLVSIVSALDPEEYGINIADVLT